MYINDLIIVIAKIKMKTTLNGGRENGFISGYRPNHVFEFSDNEQNLRTFIGDIVFDGEELFNPGKIKIVFVRFLKNQDIEEYIKIGQKWFINEGSKTVGYGEIIEI